MDLWGVEIKGRRGYINRMMLRETKVLKSELPFLVDTEVVKKPNDGDTSARRARPEIVPSKTTRRYEVVDGTTIYSGGNVQLRAEDNLSGTDENNTGNNADVSNKELKVPVVSSAESPSSNADQVEVVEDKHVDEGDAVIDNVITSFTEWLKEREDEDSDDEDREDGDDGSDEDEDDEENGGEKKNEVDGNDQNRRQNIGSSEQITSGNTDSDAEYVEIVTEELEETDSVATVPTYQVEAKSQLEDGFDWVENVTERDISESKRGEVDNLLGNVEESALKENVVRFVGKDLNVNEHGEVETEENSKITKENVDFMENVTENNSKDMEIVINSENIGNTNASEGNLEKDLTTGFVEKIIENAFHETDANQDVSLSTENYVKSRHILGEVHENETGDFDVQIPEENLSPSPQNATQGKLTTETSEKTFHDEALNNSDANVEVVVANDSGNVIFATPPPVTESYSYGGDLPFSVLDDVTPNPLEVDRDVEQTREEIPSESDEISSQYVTGSLPSVTHGGETDIPSESHVGNLSDDELERFTVTDGTTAPENVSEFVENQTTDGSSQNVAENNGNDDEETVDYVEFGTDDVSTESEVKSEPAEGEERAAAGDLNKTVDESNDGSFISDLFAGWFDGGSATSDGNVEQIPSGEDVETDAAHGEIDSHSEYNKWIHRGVENIGKIVDDYVSKRSEGIKILFPVA